MAALTRFLQIYCSFFGEERCGTSLHFTAGERECMVCEAKLRSHSGTVDSHDLNRTHCSRGLSKEIEPSNAKTSRHKMCAMSV